MATLPAGADVAVLAPRRRAGAVALLAAFCALATLSLAQGILDVTLPRVLGTEPFGVLYGLSGAYGPSFYFAYVLAHNLGLACIVPGYGFAGAWMDQRPMQRRVIAAMLLAGVASGLALTLAALLSAQERFQLAVALPLYLGEAVSVLVMAALSARELVRFDARRGFRPLLALLWPFAVSAALLALLAAVETVFVFTIR